MFKKFKYYFKSSHMYRYVFMCIDIKYSRSVCFKIHSWKDGDSYKNLTSSPSNSEGANNSEELN